MSRSSFFFDDGIVLSSKFASWLICSHGSVVYQNQLDPKISWDFGFGTSIGQLTVPDSQNKAS